MRVLHASSIGSPALIDLVDGKLLHGADNVTFDNAQRWTRPPPLRLPAALAREPLKPLARCADRMNCPATELCSAASTRTRPLGVRSTDAGNQAAFGVVPKNGNIPKHGRSDALPVFRLRIRVPSTTFFSDDAFHDRIPVKSEIGAFRRRIDIGLAGAQGTTDHDVDPSGEAREFEGFLQGAVAPPPTTTTSLVAIERTVTGRALRNSSSPVFVRSAGPHQVYAAPLLWQLPHCAPEAPIASS